MLKVDGWKEHWELDEHACPSGAQKKGHNDHALHINLGTQLTRDKIGII